MNTQSGVSLVEVLVVVAVMAIALGIGALSLDTIESPLPNAVSLVEGSLREARMSAIASTSAHRVSLGGTTGLRAERAASCSDTAWTPVPKLDLDLPQGVVAGPSGWTVCFSSRGISTVNAILKLAHPDYGSTGVEVLVGGTTREVE